jgi:hypothetical protein
LAVLASIRAGRLVETGAKKTTLLGARSAIVADRPINYQQVEDREPKFNWDKKRRLLNSGVNPWVGYTKTAPYSTLGRLEEAERRKLVLQEKVRLERRKQSKQRRDNVIRLLGEGGHSVREIAKATGVSKSTIQRLNSSMRWAEMDSYKMTKGLGDGRSSVPKSAGDRKGAVDGHVAEHGRDADGANPEGKAKPE